MREMQPKFVMKTRKEKWHKCINCGYIMQDLLIKYARFDFGCPRCNMSYKYFKPITAIFGRNDVTIKE
jgi:rubrerythrin